MECLAGFASSIARDFACCVVDELRYPCCFNKFVEDLQNEEDEFVETRKSVQERVDHAKNQTKKTTGLVRKWVKQADTEIDNVEQLLKEARTNNSCCFGHFPNWIWRYRLGKKLAEKKGLVKKCIEEGSNYKQIERLATLPGLRHFSSERCLKFDSRQSAYEKLMEALKDDEVTLIGMYGMGGCGKTTLAIEVGKKATQEDIFPKVLFVAVSSTVEVQRIQEKIASSLGFELQEKEEMERAQRLCMRLTEEEKILVILDDVWQRLDFEAIGIPSSKNHNGCKVLITTRSEDVCAQMDCQRKIQLPILTDEEAWDLFQKQAHIFVGTSNNLKHLARQISDECEGLPVAIAAVASSLKDKAEAEWKVALKRLKGSKPVNIEKGLQNPYNCLKLSYDNLYKEEAESLFLLCSVFPEDYEIPVEDLTRYAIGLGLVGEVCSYEGARDEVIAAKNKLVSSCLLSYDDALSGDCVKMHDLVRDVAQWIARNKNKMIACALEDDVIEEYSSLRYLWCEKFSNELDYSNLEFLCIDKVLEVSDEIFKGMGKLRVLLLYTREWGSRRPPLTTSFKWLTNLRCLLLDGWKLGDISFVGDLKKLESLTLSWCSFLELPNDVVRPLTNLRLLDISGCHFERSPFEVIGGLPLLEELYINDTLENADELFKKFSVPQALQRYQIGRCRFPQAKPHNHHKILYLRWFDTSNEAVKDLAKKAEVLHMGDIQGGAKNIIPDIFQIEGRGMNDLIELLIHDSNEIECLVNMEHLGALYHGRLPPSGLFEKLEQLHLYHCPQLHSTLFDWKLHLCSLKVLKLENCPKLTSLLTLAVAQSLVQLEEIDIRSCNGLKHILTDDDTDKIRTDDHRLLFPKLKQLEVSYCKELEYIIPVTFTLGLLQLKHLEIRDNPELKYVFGQCTHIDQLADHSQNELKIELPALEELILTDMPNIISVFPKDCHPTWPSLCRFGLKNCPEFATMSIKGCIAGSKVGKHCDHNTTKLEGLSIDGEQDPLTMCLQELCLVDLPQLKELPIENCNQLDQIIEDEKRQMESNQLKKFPESTSIPSAPLVNYNSGSFIACLVTAFSKTKLAFRRRKYLWHSANAHKTSSCKPQLAIQKIQNNQAFNLSNLTRLMLKSCPMLGSLFTASIAEVFTSLEELEIEECHGLRHLVTCEKAHKNKEEDIIQEDHDSRSYVSMFPRLISIRVKNCNLLEYIFHVSFFQGMVKLKVTKIKQTPQLRYVFGQSIHEDVHTSHQYQNKIQIELPALEEVSLRRIPNMISICPDTYYATCSSLRQLEMNDVGLSTRSINNLIVDSGATVFNHSSTTDIGAASMTNTRQIKGIFHLEGLPINGQQVTSRLNDLKLINLPELGYIWTGAKHLVNLQHLYQLHICNCPKLKVIFSACVLRILPLLKILVVEKCEELEQIIEEDEENENVSNPQSPKICFSQLKLISVKHCNNLKRLFYISTSHGFPKLEYLIVYQDSLLVQVFEGELGAREGKVDVLLPKLKHVTLMQLPNLYNICQGIEFHTLTDLVVHNCPKLSLTSTTSVEDQLQNFDPDMEIHSLFRRELRYISDIITKEAANKDPMPETTSQLQMSPQDQGASKSELPSSQVNDTNQFMMGNLAGPVHEHNPIERGATEVESYEFLTSERENKGTQDFQSLEQKLPPIPSSNLKQSIEDTGKESIQEGSTSEEAMKATFLGGAVATHTDSSGGDMLAQDSQVVEQGDKPNEGETGTLPCQKIQNVDDSISIQKGSNLKDKEGEIGVVSNDSIAAPRSEPEKEFVGKFSISKMPAIATSPKDSEMLERPSPNPLDIPLHKTHSNESVDGQSMGDPCLMNQQKPLGESESNIEIPQSITRGLEEETTSKNANIVTSSTRSEPARSQSGPSLTPQRKSYPHSDMRLSQTETYTDKESEGHPINIQDLEDDDLINLFQPVEEDGDGQIPTPSVSVVAAEHPATKDNLVVKVLADLEVSLKMPLKDIASSEANSLRLMTALNFLSRLPLEDGTLSDGLKAIIDSLHQEFPSILCSFKQAFATTNKFAVLGEKEKSIKEELAHRNEVAVTLVSKISKAKNFMDEAQQKKAILKEQINRLEQEIKDCEANLSSLQEEKKKCIEETIGYKKEFENVRKDKSQMVEDQRTARQELFEVDYKWSALFSQFEHNRIAARNPS